MASKHIEWHIFSSGESLDGVVHADVQHLSTFHRSPHRYLGKLLWQWAAVNVPLYKGFDAVVYVGDPNHLSTWAGTLACRFCGIPSFFWLHGWRRREHGMRRLIRNVFYSLASGLLLYSERGKRLGVDSGFPAERMTVIYNSLDTGQAASVIDRIEKGSIAPVNPHSFFDNTAYPVLVCTGRLLKSVRLDLLIEAAAHLARRGRPVNILLIGDGPERQLLEEMARQREVSVHFFGACYDEEITGQIIYRSNLMVAPGKIGLTAMHSLMYGTPAITHGNLDEQMPEVEAIVDGVTGAFFRQGDANHLADVIDLWLLNQPDRAAVRRAAFAEINGKWTPQRQAELIEEAVMAELGRRRK